MGTRAGTLQLERRTRCKGGAACGVRLEEASASSPAAAVCAEQGNARTGERSHPRSVPSGGAGAGGARAVDGDARSRIGLPEPEPEFESGRGRGLELDQSRGGGTERLTSQGDEYAR